MRKDIMITVIDYTIATILIIGNLIAIAIVLTNI
jgi:hypothetical protein